MRASGPYGPFDPAPVRKEYGYRCSSAASHLMSTTIVGGWGRTSTGNVERVGKARKIQGVQAFRAQARIDVDAVHQLGAAQAIERIRQGLATLRKRLCDEAVEQRKVVDEEIGCARLKTHARRKIGRAHV